MAGTAFQSRCHGGQSNLRLRRQERRSNEEQGKKEAFHDGHRWPWHESRFGERVTVAVWKGSVPELRIGRFVIVAFRSTKDACFRGAKGDTCFRADPTVPLHSSRYPGCQ